MIWIADRQAVVDSMAEGTSREDSLKEYLSDENFEKWYADIYAKLVSMRAEVIRKF